MSGVSDYDTTASNNTPAGTESIRSGDDQIRQMKADIASYTRAGSDLASASTLDLDSVDSLWLAVTGTTTVTAVTLAEGHTRHVRATGAFQITASASLIVNGSTTVNYTTTAGDLLFFEGYGSSVVRVWVIGDTKIFASGTWTPVPTFASGSAASVTVNSARYQRSGAAVHFTCDVSFRVGTGSGGFTIAGLPFANISAFASVAIGYLDRVDTISGTQLFAAVGPSTSGISFYSKVNDGTNTVMVSAGASNYFNESANDMRVMVSGTYFVA